MALNLRRSGYSILEYEIAEEKASALGRRLEAALAALAACPRTANADRKIRDRLVQQAGYALWLFVVQREACGLNNSAQVMSYRHPGRSPSRSDRSARRIAAASAASDSGGSTWGSSVRTPRAACRSERWTGGSPA